MTGLLLMWLLVGQALSGLPAMLPGTEVQIVLPDLLTVLGKAVVEDNRLVFDTDLPPGTEVRLIISYSPEGKLAVPSGRVSPSGDDILVQFEGARGPVSLREWLMEARNIRLVIPAGGGRDR